MSNYPPQSVPNSKGGFDLMVEVDTDKLVRIGTGRYTTSLEFWKELSQLANDMVFKMENEDDGSEEHEDFFNDGELDPSGGRGLKSHE